MAPKKPDDIDQELDPNPYKPGRPVGTSPTKGISNDLIRASLIMLFCLVTAWVISRPSVHEFIFYKLIEIISRWTFGDSGGFQSSTSWLTIWVS